MIAQRYFFSLLVCVFVCNTCVAQPKLNFIQLVSAAEKATADKNWEQAVTLWQMVNEQNPVHHNYTYQLGNAYMQVANYPKALEYFDKNSALSGDKSYYSAFNIARVYARMGDINKAMQWIRKSFDLGIPERNSLKHQDFAVLKDIEYLKLSNQYDASRLGRIEGWKYDLQFLYEEINRKAFGVVRSFTKDELKNERDRILGLISNLTDVEIALEFQKLLVKVGDGHTALFLNKETPELRKHLPLEFYRFKEGLYIIQTEARFKEYLGAKVINIEGKTPEAIYVALAPIIRKDNNITPLMLSASLIRQTSIMHAMKLSSSPDQLKLKVQLPNGDVSDIVLKGESDISSRKLWDGLPSNWVSIENEMPQKPFYLKNRYKHFWFEYLEKEKTLWLQYNEMLTSREEPWSDFLDSAFAFIETHPTQRLIIDMRNNNGGNGEWATPLVRHLLKNSMINQRGKLFVIIGRKTFSAAGIAIGQLEKNTNAIFAGEPAGTSPNFIGEEFEFELPYSRLWANVSEREHKTYSVDYRAWIAPVLYAEPSFRDLVAGRDAVWEMILENYPMWR